LPDGRIICAGGRIQRWQSVIGGDVGAAGAEADQDYMAFVGGVPCTLTELELACVFSKFGEVRSIRVVRKDKPNEHKKGYGFVKFATKEAASEVGLCTLESS
jgi:hypothetical protein